MISKTNIKKIEETCDEFFKKMTFDVGIKVRKQKDTTIPIDLQIEEPQILIGEKGQTLAEIQRLLKIILKRGIDFSEEEDKDFYIDLDINDYKKKKAEYLKELAKSIADEVALLKEEKLLPPMSAYERRIIHLEIAERNDVVSESVGMEPERKIVIKPKP